MPILGALLAAGVLAACGQTRGLILGEAPGNNGVDAATDDAAPSAAATGDAGSACGACSGAVTLTGASLTVEQGGTTGTPFTDTCPGSQAVIGFQGFLTDPSVGLILVGGIQATCGALTVNGPLPSQVSTSAGATLPMRGASQASPWTQMCPPGQVVVGFTGSSGAALDQAAFVCAPWIASSGASGGVLSMGTPVTLAPAGGDGGTPYPEVACPPGQLARGSYSNSGEWVDAFGLVCGAPSIASDGGP